MKIETSVPDPAPANVFAPPTITVSITLTRHEARDLLIRNEEEPEHPVVEKIRAALRAARP
jgi:hypothetical protein